MPSYSELVRVISSVAYSSVPGIMEHYGVRAIAYGVLCKQFLTYRHKIEPVRQDSPKTRPNRA
jgi:hypothetical protein